MSELEKLSDSNKVAKKRTGNNLPKSGPWEIDSVKSFTNANTNDFISYMDDDCTVIEREKLAFAKETSEYHCITILDI